MITTAKPKTVFEALLKLGHDEDFTPLANASFLPTDAPPGSPEKVEVLRLRAELGQPLWHRHDRVDFNGLTGVIEPRYESGPRGYVPVEDESLEAQGEGVGDLGNRGAHISSAGVASPFEALRQPARTRRYEPIETRPEPRSSSDDTAGRNRSSSGNGIGSESKVRAPTQEEQRLLGVARTAFRSGSITHDSFLSEVRNLIRAGVDVGDLRLELPPQEVA